MAVAPVRYAELYATGGDSGVPTVDQVGGKGLSLIRSARAGFAVPPAVVLSTAFFVPWVEQIAASPEWLALAGAAGNASPDAGSGAFAALKRRCQQLELSDSQQRTLTDCRLRLAAPELASANTAAQSSAPARTAGGTLFAVRSSSPEEDREDNSFAGVYESVIGVPADGLEAAIVTCFTSAFDERVVAYKRQNGLDTGVPRIAVIVQRQIAADTAGVAFSLNPVNNCYDEAVINANYGLGQTVVDGTVTPDQFVVDKIAGAVIDTVIGAKEAGHYTRAGGGIEERAPEAPGTACLTDDEVCAVAALASAIEAEYGMPMDIEWAYSGDELFLLQARPITAYVRLPEEMLTEPGAPKMLYQDGLLTEQGLVDSLSPLGEGVLIEMTKTLVTALGADERIATRDNGVVFGAVGRMFVPLGNMAKVSGTRTVIKAVGSVDAVGARVLESIDLKQYMPKRIPKGLLKSMLRMALASVGVLPRVLSAYRHPSDYLALLHRETEGMRTEVAAAEADPIISFGAFSEQSARRLGIWMNFVSLPTLYSAEWARSRIKKMFAREAPAVRDQIPFIEQAFPDNVTIEMGLLLGDLATFPEIQQIETADEFLDKLEQRQLAVGLLDKWDLFMERYGHRHPKEIDVATDRYRDRPQEIFRLLKTMAVPGGGDRPAESGPRAVFERGVRRREAAFEALQEALGSGSRRKLKRLAKRYRVLTAFAPYREFHKFQMVAIIEQIQHRARALGRAWVEAGRLDSPEQVYDLKHEEVCRAETDPQLDLRRLAVANRQHFAQFNRNRNPPSLIDSRGWIPTLPAEGGSDTELIGTPVSPGVVVGPVKILTRPDEKPVLPGDILVARATDPGWTTLFLNAAGVLLETGGALQHGASVARESCKPCVVGISGLTAKLRDEQTVELDGSTGRVTLLD